MDQGPATVATYRVSEKGLATFVAAVDVTVLTIIASRDSCRIINDRYMGANFNFIYQKRPFNIYLVEL